MSYILISVSFARIVHVLQVILKCEKYINMINLLNKTERLKIDSLFSVRK